MSRWLKVLLPVMVVAGIGLGSLPWWLGLALRPVLRSAGVTFERYERVGYAHFRLHGLLYQTAQIKVSAQQAETVTPALWLAQRLRGTEPTLLVTDWRAEHLAARGTDRPAAIAGLPDLQAARQRLEPRLKYWLPHVRLTAGTWHGFGADVTVAQADWHNSTLRVTGMRIADRVLAVVIAPAADGSVVLTAQTEDNAARLQLVWSGAEINGEARVWDQPVQLAARFPARGWFPTEASAIAENWRLPAARVNLGVPYDQVEGTGRLTWRDGVFDLAVEAKARPAADTKTKAPPFEARAAAHGSLHEFALTALRVEAPFATATLTAPVTFSLDHPLSAESAQLVVQADLAKLPWIKAGGLVHGTVTVSGDNAAASQTFELDCTDVVLNGFAVKTAQARGVLHWPILELSEFSAQLDDTSAIKARGAMNCQDRQLTGTTLSAKLGGAWLAHWLPGVAAGATAEITATADGPLVELRHEGSLKLTQVQWKPLQPVALEAAWHGVGANAEITGTAAASGSTIELTGSLNPQGLNLTRFKFSPAGEAVWQLAAPAQLSWAPVWQVDQLQLSGPASNLTFKGRGGAEGFVAVDATAIKSAWLQDWVTLAGPGWQVHHGHAAGKFTGAVLVFETSLDAEIEMSPRPAQLKLTASGDAQGVQLTELKVVDGDRVLTEVTGRLPAVWTLVPAPHLLLAENLPLELSASTDPASPLWAALAASTGLELTKPEAKIDLHGTLLQPAGELKLKVAQVTATPGHFKTTLPDLADVSLDLAFDRAGATLTALSAKAEGQAVRATGRVSMDAGRWEQLWRQPAAFDWRTVEARVEVPDADLAPLARRFPAFPAAQGRLQAQLTLKSGGQLSGELHLTDAASRPMPPFGALQEIKADLAFADDTVTVRTLTAKLGGEPVTLAGTATFAPEKPLRLALTLQGKNLPLVRNTGLLVRTDLDLHADTDAGGTTRLGGSVEVRDCLMLASLSLRTLLPSGQRGVTRRPPYFAVEAEPFRHWPLAVEVRARNSVRVRTTVFNGTASGRFQLSGTLGEPRAVGELTVDQGQVLFPFATFKVQSGSVRLREADPYRAVVNLTATSQRRDYQLRLEATGDLPTPNILLSSTPSLQAGEVMLMVMTGQAPTGATTSFGGQRLVLLGAYLSRGLFQDLGIVGDDRLEVSSGEQVSELGRDTYEFEYKLGERWSALGEYDRFDSYNAGLKWRVYTQESGPVEKK